jgi:hypothetical protein
MCPLPLPLPLPLQPHANRQAKSLEGDLHGEVQWHPSGITLHSLSVNVSSWTAIFRTRGGLGILTTSQAVNFLKHAYAAAAFRQLSLAVPQWHAGR